MKGVDVNKYNLQFGHRKNELLLNELKVSELKLNTNKCFLPLIENHKEKKVTTFSNDSNNFSTSDNKVGLGKLFLKNRNLKKNVLTFNKKEADSIFEISIENFKNKIFKKRKSNVRILLFI